MTEPDDDARLDAAAGEAHARIARLHEEAQANIRRRTNGPGYIAPRDGLTADAASTSAPDQRDQATISGQVSHTWPDQAQDGDAEQPPPHTRDYLPAE